MPFDGIVAKNISIELSDLLLGGRIEKVFQPYKDEIVLSIRSYRQNLKLLISANASFPRIHITEIQKENPTTPPIFCMLLRKYIGNGKIIGIEFNNYERIITIVIESLTDLKDIAVRKLVVEIMGKHSNVILLNNENKIIDSIFHVDKSTSSFREVMPARTYTLPPEQNKQNPENIDFDVFFDEMKNHSHIVLEKYILNSLKGFSPLLAREVCHASSLDCKALISQISEADNKKLKEVLSQISYSILHNDFKPCIFFSDPGCLKPIDFHALEITQNTNIRFYPSISKVLDLFSSTKENIDKRNQKKSDLIKIINKNISRILKKESIYRETLKDASNMDKFKLFGELIIANIYSIDPDMEKVSLLNYYSEYNEYTEVPLDKNLSPQENAQDYFKKYTKAKTSSIYAEKQLADAHKELEYLESVFELLGNCVTDREVDEIKEELLEEGYILQKIKKSSKKQTKVSSPGRFLSSNGFEILVGKNNKQNDHLTLKFASSNDLWLHTKDLPGSHVIIRKQGKEIPENTLLEAATLASYFSKGKFSSNVQVDYTSVKNVKKPSGAKPGMVIYNNFKTIIVTPDESVTIKLKNDT